MCRQKIIGYNDVGGDSDRFPDSTKRSNTSPIEKSGVGEIGEEKLDTTLPKTVLFLHVINHGVWLQSREMFILLAFD